jgi:DNA polymerase III subunit delta
MLFFLIGNDRTLIEQQIKHLLANYRLEKYSTLEDINQACLRCLALSLMEEVTATVLELSLEELKNLDLRQIPRLHKSKNLLFLLCENLDSRTKTAQALQPYLVSDAKLPPNGHQQGIDRGIDFYARQLGLNLSFEAKEYLRQALNNNFPMLRNGLETIALLTPNPDLALVKEVIPSEYASAIELKEMILQRRRGEIPAYVAKLMAFTGDRVILASLKTQFTLLMQTAIGINSHLNDPEIAKFAQISNVKRLYFLRRELQHISIEQIIWLNNQIETTKQDLNHNTCSLTARLMLMCCY